MISSSVSLPPTSCPFSTSLTSSWSFSIFAYFMLLMFLNVAISCPLCSHICRLAEL
nr:MAG TPA: hypothetical protein [Bacteriophage sp.]